MKNNNLSVKLPIDILKELWPGSLKGAGIGALLHPASISSTILHSLDILKSHDGTLFNLKCLFGPQHGFLGQTQDNMIEWQNMKHDELNIPIYSLYGEHRSPTDKMLDGLEAFLIDLQDVGARYYTFIWTMFLCMKACEKKNIPVVVLDRPNPINAITVEGDLPDPKYQSFVGLHPIPARHGKTIGQLARQFKSECFPHVELEVLEMKGYRDDMWFEDTGLPWVMPSPNMPTPDTAVVYPGMCLFEGTNISEGRGTTRPFELFGAPFIERGVFVKALDALGLPGVYFRETSFQPTFHKFMGDLCNGAQIHITDRDRFLPYQTGVEIIRLIKKMYTEKFAWKKPPYEYEYEKLPIEVLIGGPVSRIFPD
ncbi:MAG: DUF1343 domain-containing protein [Fibrobacteria bacterium]|nr:DUF1343 domain-containing protein [Fibrobacteria bacterium]